MCILKAPQYVFEGLVGVSPKLMRSALIAFDTGAGFHLVREIFLHHGLHEHLIAYNSLPSLVDANGYRFPLSGAVELRLQLGLPKYLLRLQTIGSPYYLRDRLHEQAYEGHPLHGPVHRAGTRR